MPILPNMFPPVGNTFAIRPGLAPGVYDISPERTLPTGETVYSDHKPELDLGRPDESRCSICQRPLIWVTSHKEQSWGHAPVTPLPTGPAKLDPAPEPKPRPAHRAEPMINTPAPTAYFQRPIDVAHAIRDALPSGVEPRITLSNLVEVARKLEESGYVVIRLDAPTLER